MHCFVIRGFGTKEESDGRSVDADAVDRTPIAPVLAQGEARTRADISRAEWLALTDPVPAGGHGSRRVTQPAAPSAWRAGPLQR